MSQRLHIGATEDQCYDCVIDSPFGVAVELQRKWLTTSFGLKIAISDFALFREIEPTLIRVLKKNYLNYPDCLWAVYFDDVKLIYPQTREEIWEAIVSHEKRRKSLLYRAKNQFSKLLRWVGTHLGKVPA